MNDEILFEVLPGQGGDVGCVTLNRPRALNALTFTMCHGLHHKLQQWQQDASIKGVIIRGAGDRAFCAGGDVRSIYEIRGDVDKAMTFFREEYAMNTALFHFSKPYIALLDGITMGGGVGVSLYGSHRVATEHFSFAMPETLIGFFPDIGAGYFLNRCPNYTGYYLGLVGATIGASDAYALGLVNHVVARESLHALMESLCMTAWGKNPKEKVTQLIQAFTLKVGKPALEPYVAKIADCFSAASIKEIFLRLEADDSAWSLEVVDQLQKRSPTSLVVSLEYLQRCAKLSFDEIMQMNLALTERFMRHHDFFEGVRAVLIDKDQAPVWQPDTVSEVKNVSEYFSF